MVDAVVKRLELRIPLVVHILMVADIELVQEHVVLVLLKKLLEALLNRFPLLHNVLAEAHQNLEIDTRVQHFDVVLHVQGHYVAVEGLEPVEAQIELADIQKPVAGQEKLGVLKLFVDRFFGQTDEIDHQDVACDLLVLLVVVRVEELV